MTMKKKVKCLLKHIGELAERMQVSVYAVGGFVRDELLKRDCQEIDFVVTGDGPEFARAACSALNGHGWVTYAKFGTASFLTGDLKLEFVTARSESYESGSRNPRIEPSPLEEDLKRRDFTINTLAMSLDEANFGTIIDLHNGKADIRQGMIRTPLDPESTFHDDPLRIMRAARFASQLAFEVDGATQEAMEKERTRLKIVSQERITEEMLKILAHDTPSIGFRLLQRVRVLEIVFPELNALKGIEQRDDYHHKDGFEHTMKVVDNVAGMTDSQDLRFAALMHDIGKPRVKRFISGTGWTFYGHELVGVKMIPSICRRLKISNTLCKYAVELTRLHMRPIQLIGEEVTDSAVRRLLFQAGDRIEDLMTLCRADITSGNPDRVKKHMANFDRVARKMVAVEEKDRMRAFQSPVRGDEIMAVCGIGPGPQVGKLKTMIEEAILEGEIPNDHDAAYAYLLKIKDNAHK